MARVVNPRQFEFVRVIGSHGLFPPEEETWARCLGVPVEFSSFGELLDDEDAIACDHFAEAGAARLAGQGLYNTEYQRLVVEAKNALIASRVLGSNQFSAIHFQPGLGIEAKIWRKHGGRRIATSPPVLVENWNWRVTRLLRKRGRPEVFRLVYGGCTFFIYGGHGRLPISSEIRGKVERVEHGVATVLETMSSSPQACHPALLVALHNYSANLHEFDIPLEVIADGYHPINYPRSYLGAFRPCTIVARDRNDADWFGKHGFIVRAPLPFMESAAMRSEFRCRRSHPVVLLALNHAGDWTALINRDDTDILVKAFCELAESFPRLEFVVRGHPTMAEPSHEGVGSYTRLKRYVTGLQLPNLCWSALDAEHDLDRADLVVSEYSNMLLQAWRAGICGIAVNLTRRRSFMESFGSLGFPHVSSFNALFDEIQTFLSEPQQFRGRQINAAQRYNEEVAL